jgi:transposase, IS30 family
MSNYTQLSNEERYCITAGLKRHQSIQEIAEELGRHRSTIYRELERNRTHHDGDYRALIAHSYATARRRRERRGSHFGTEEWKEVETLLGQDHSPEQVSGGLRREGKLNISYETIYQYILKDMRRGGVLYKHLRQKIRRHRKRNCRHDKRIVLPEKRHISTRPVSAENRSRKGHWEGDTVFGADRHHSILTLVERKTGYAIIKKISARTIVETNRSLGDAILEMNGRIKTLTFDNGIEFFGYKELEANYPVKCYFATPYHSWERGSNENLNGLIRQYLPKGISMKGLTQVECDWIANRLNTRPRKRYGYRTPEELFYAT